jgi:hypothetical protein
MKAFKLPRALFLNKEDQIKEIKFEERKFQGVSKTGFSKKTNEDLSQFIKEELIKKTHRETYSNLDKYMVKLIKLVYKQIHDSIYFDSEIKKLYFNKDFIPERDVKILYDIIILIFNYVPSKVFKLTKYKISKVRKYFIYGVESEKYKNVKYVIFDYSHYGEKESLLWFYTATSENDLKDTIKQNFKMVNPETKKKQKVSLNRSERSSKFDAKYYSSDSNPSGSPSGSGSGSGSRSRTSSSSR